MIDLFFTVFFIASFSLVLGIGGLIAWVCGLD